MSNLKEVVKEIVDGIIGHDPYDPYLEWEQWATLKGYDLRSQGPAILPPKPRAHNQIF